MKPGQIVQINILASTSVNVFTAIQFMRMPYQVGVGNNIGLSQIPLLMNSEQNLNQNAFNKRCIAVIEIMRNSKIPVLVPGGAYIEHFTESEVLLPPGTKVKFIQEWKDDDPYHRIKFRHFQVVVNQESVGLSGHVEEEGSKGGSK